MQVFRDQVLAFVPKENAAFASGESNNRGGLDHCGSKYKHERLLMAAELSMKRQPGDIVEIGVLGGGQTVRLAKLAHRYGQRVIAVDPWLPASSGYRYSATCTETTRSEFMGRVRKYLHMIDVLHDFSQSTEVINFIKARPVSFVFIDGAPIYEACFIDIKTVWHCEGIIAMDDLWMKGVKRAFLEAGERPGKEAFYHDVLAEGYLLPTAKG